MNVLEKSVADVSFLVGLLVDKFAYHLPLYRQHQRLSAAGITLSRATLTNLVKQAIALLKPIVDAQRDSVLQSRVLAMDETPCKVGKSKKKKGKMHQGYFWPMYGDKDEIVFTYSDSRARRVIEQLLNEQFMGTLISDGYSAMRLILKTPQRPLMPSAGRIPDASSLMPKRMSRLWSMRCLSVSADCTPLKMR